MVTLSKRIKGFVAGLIRLVVICLVVEQLGYLVLVPDYLWELLASPVFWALFSVVCFYLLWRFDNKYPEGYVSLDNDDGWKPKRRINPTTGLPMTGGIDAGGTPYGGSPESGFIKPDSFWLISR